MEPTSDKHFSFPNSDQPIPGVTDASRPQPEEIVFPNRPQRPTVNIIDALTSQKKEEGELQRIHTYQEDIATAIKDDNLSMIKMSLAEKKRQERQSSELVLDGDSSKKYIIVGIIALATIFIFGGIYFYIARSNSNNAENTNIPAVAAPLLYTEDNALIHIDQRDTEDVVRLIKRELDKPLDLGSMRSISLVLGVGTSTRQIKTGELFRTLDTTASDILIRSLDNRFLFGLYSFTPNDFFFLVKVKSYDNAFASMLQWEPDIENNIGNIFITKKPPVPINVLSKPKTASDSGFGTSTPSEQRSDSVSQFVATPLNGRVWVDRVVDNKDARVLIDKDGTTAMLYTFLDKDTLVIATSDKSLKEIIFRLTAGRIAR